MIWQRFAMEEQFRSIAKNLGVSVVTVYNISKIFEQTGWHCVRWCKQTRPSKHSSALSSKSLLTCCSKIPAYIYLGEICQKIEHIAGLKVSTSTVCHIIQRHAWVYTEKGTTSSSAEVQLIQRCMILWLRQFFSDSVAGWDRMRW